MNEITAAAARKNMRPKTTVDDILDNIYFCINMYSSQMYEFIHGTSDIKEDMLSEIIDELQNKGYKITRWPNLILISWKPGVSLEP